MWHWCHAICPSNCVLLLNSGTREDTKIVRRIKWWLASNIQVYSSGKGICYIWGLYGEGAAWNERWSFQVTCEHLETSPMSMKVRTAHCTWLLPSDNDGEYRHREKVPRPFWCGRDVIGWLHRMKRALQSSAWILLRGWCATLLSMFQPSLIMRGQTNFREGEHWYCIKRVPANSLAPA